MHNDPKQINDDHPGPLEKAFYVGGLAAGFAGHMLGAALSEAGKIIADTSKAFNQGRDPNIDDAIILEETPDDRDSSQ